MSAGKPCVWRTCGAPRRSHSNAPSTSSGIGVSSRSTTTTSHPMRDSAIAAASPPMPGADHDRPSSPAPRALPLDDARRLGPDQAVREHGLERPSSVQTVLWGARRASAVIGIVAIVGMAMRPRGRRRPGGDDGGLEYVALGDSFTSGPLVLPHDTTWVPQDCGQSIFNYPHLAAAAIGATSFTDVSCGERHPRRPVRGAGRSRRSAASTPRSSTPWVPTPTS